MLKFIKMKRRRGSLIPILLFSIMMAIMTFGTLSVATSLYASGEQSSKRYSHIQSYRAAAEMACYQYVNDLQAVVVTKTLSGDWISVTGSAVYTQACEAIPEEIGKTDDPLVWNVPTIEAAISGAGVTDASVVTNLLGLLTEGQTTFQLSILDYPEIDWEAGESYIRSNESELKLIPIQVNIELAVKGEMLKETLYVSGLYLNVVQTKTIDASGGRDTSVTMRLSQGESGVQIYRE